jgi:hypothetical protein
VRYPAGAPIAVASGAKALLSPKDLPIAFLKPNNLLFVRWSASLTIRLDTGTTADFGFLEPVSPPRKFAATRLVGGTDLAALHRDAASRSP